MIKLVYTEQFLKKFAKLDEYKKHKFAQKIEEFKNPQNHRKLKVHKLKGKLKGYYSFSVDRKNRIIFRYAKSRDEVIMINLGDHDIYK